LVTEAGDTITVTAEGTNLFNVEEISYQLKYEDESKLADILTYAGNRVSTKDFTYSNVNGTDKIEFNVTIPSVERYSTAKKWVLEVFTSSEQSYGKTTDRIAISKLSNVKASTDGTITLNGYELPENASYQIQYQYVSETGENVWGEFGETNTATLSGTNTSKTFKVDVPDKIEEKTVTGWKVKAWLLEDYSSESGMVAAARSKSLSIEVRDADTDEPVPGVVLSMICNGSCDPYYFKATDENGEASCSIIGGNATFVLEPRNDNEYTDEYTCENPAEILISKDSATETGSAYKNSYINKVNGEVYVGDKVVIKVKKRVTTEHLKSLTDLLDEAGSLDKNSYREETWKAYENAVNEAEKLNKKSTDEKVLDAIKALEVAKAGLVVKEKEESATKVDPKPVSVTKISISGASKKIAAGKKIQLTATVAPSNASNKAVTWSTSNKKYATVSATGKVTVKAAGAGKTVTITAAAKDGSGVKQTYKITIMKNAVKSIKLSAAKTVKAGKSVTVKATVKTTGKKVNKTLKWTSSNTKYATVNSKGKVTAKKAGKGKTVKITAAATDGSGKKATVKIKIK
jgi:uncharacterized protein YjdB